MNQPSAASVPSFHPDGLSITAAEPWFKVKVKVIERYVQSFIAHAAGRADEIIFIDLAAGSGLFSHGHQKHIFPGASLALLRDNLPFSRWILCEDQPAHAFALKARVQQWFRHRDVTVIDDPADRWIDALRAYLPKSNRGNKTAVLCLADAFSLSPAFALVDALAASGCSFLMPFTWPLNDRMSGNYYCSEQAGLLKAYLGVGDVQRLAAAASNQQFYKHLVRMYQNNMLMLGLNTALSMHKLESNFMRLPAYHIGFFSRQFSSQAIQREVIRGEAVQTGLFQ